MPGYDTTDWQVPPCTLQSIYTKCETTLKQFCHYCFHNTKVSGRHISFHCFFSQRAMLQEHGVLTLNIRGAT